MLLNSVPAFMASLGCLERIQDFLASKVEDGSRFPDTSLPNVIKERSFISSAELRDLALKPAFQSKWPSSVDDIVTLENASFGVKVNELPILQNISIKVRLARLTMIVGPVA